MSRPILARPGIGALACCALFSASAFGQVIVRMETNLGNIDIELYDDAAPVTVQNFLNYVDSSRYDDTIIHRSMPGFIIQGGGYSIGTGAVTVVTAYPPIVNEYDPSRSNIRGTIAMAKLDGNPNSATSGWFFNLADNSANLDVQNGGFTVFGQVLGNGMEVVDAIAALTILNCGGGFTDVPIINLATCPTLSQLDHLVTVRSVRQILNIQDNQATVRGIAGNNVTFIAAAPATLSNVAASDNPHPEDAPADVTFREGFFSFQVDGISPGGATTVAIQLPSGYVPNTYYMYGPTPDNHNPHWYEFTYDGQTGARFFNNNYVVLYFIDGARGDADLIANGQISDPGAPGISTAAAVSSTSGGGGCTLSPNSGHSHMRMDYWLLLALAIAARYWHRARTGIGTSASTSSRT